MTVTGPVSESYYSFIRDVITTCLSWWFIHIMLNVIGCLETNLLHRQGWNCCPSDSEKGAEIQVLWDHRAKKKSQNEMGTQMLQSFWLKSVSATCPASHYRDSFPRDCIIWCLSIASSGVLCILVTACPLLDLLPVSLCDSDALYF